MFRMKAFGKSFKGETLAEMSRQYEAARDAHFAKGGRPQNAIIYRGENVAGHVSNNGRVWAGSPRDWTVDTKPIYDNRAA